MTQGIHRLSKTTVGKIARRGLHADGGGLYLQIAANGSRSWLFRYSRHGRTRHLGLGPLHVVALKTAREKARESRHLLHDGIDPLDHKNTQRATALLEAAKAMTFDDCATSYIDSHKVGWKNDKHVAQWQSTLKTYVAPVLGRLPIQTIDTALVMKTLDPIWKTKPETASRLRGRIEAILAWACVRGYRQGDNPARWKNHLDQLLPARGKVHAVKHHAALPFSEISAFVAELRKREAVAARALEFLILNASRTSEVLLARWDEIDIDTRVWTIPAERMKGKREHRVPLSDAGLHVLDQMRAFRDGDYIFPGAREGKPLSNMSLLVLLRRMGYGDLTAHGFRSSFHDWAAERTGFANEIVEMALAHAISNKTEAAYRRGDLLEKRRRLMATWADYCAESREQQPKVVPFELRH